MPDKFRFIETIRTERFLKDGIYWGAAMNEKKMIFCADRGEWRVWLSDHFEKEKEIWFVFPSVGSGEKGVSYNDAVEEALCFGWIDGQAGTLDETHQLRRFTPRKKAAPTRNRISNGLNISISAE